MRSKRALLATVILTVLPLLLPPPPAAAATITARSLLGRVSVRAESGGSTYDRDRFKHWIDQNKDCQATRAEVLISESKVTPTYSKSRCSVVKGKWYSYYDGATWTDPLDVDIDHLVALKEAWDSGARSWPAADRTAFANDIAFWPTLVAITDNVNSAKGARDPAEWLPPRAGARCTYAIQWVQVKYRWRLSVNPTERDGLRALLSGGCGSRTIVLPARGR